MEWRKDSDTTDRRNNIIPLFKGRPEREQHINNEDIINLRILLNTERNFETLLSKL